MKSELAIGGVVGTTPPQPVTLESKVLTTHGVILGMTGSGKTGLAIVLLEELARQRVPVVLCDLKGDLTNLLLTFPDLAPADFAPYVPAAEAAAGREAAAAAVAARWKEGLAGWGLGAAEIRAVREGLNWRLLTPGSGLAPVNLLPALDAPAGYDPDTDPDGARARLDGSTAGLLALVGRGGDPLTDRDHVLVATLLDAAWRAGASLDFATLIRQIGKPPVERFGVLPVEDFYPKDERQQLAVAFNTLLASPAFAAWTRGVPLAMESLIGPADAPRGSILYLAHLGERERLSFLTLLFSAVLSWTRSQPGSETLRTLLYLDEVQGIVPPTAMPATKTPLLTLLKQGRAFGTGVLLATQNPVDLDYKALGNIGLKLIGRLDTAQDRNRVLGGLDLANAEVEQKVAALKPRQFLMAGARVGEPRVITSRWAMSYLRGPLTLAELKPLVGEGAPAPAPARPSHAGAVPLLPDVEQLFAPGASLAPAVMVEAEIVYRKSTPSIERRVAGRWVAPLRESGVAWERLQQVPTQELRGAPEPGAALAGVPGNASELVKSAERAFTREVDSISLEVAWHRTLRLVQEENENRELFEERCRRAAPDGAGKEAELRRRYEEKIRRLEERIAREKLELERDEQEASARQREKTLTVATGVGEALLGALLGRRRSLGSLARKGASTARSYSSKGRMAERAQAEVEESRQTLDALERERQQLGDDLERELATLRGGAGGASEIEMLRLVPTAKDIAVRRVALAWLPPDATH